MTLNIPAEAVTKLLYIQWRTLVQRELDALGAHMEALPATATQDEIFSAVSRTQARLNGQFWDVFKQLRENM